MASNRADSMAVAVRKIYGRGKILGCASLVPSLLSLAGSHVLHSLPRSHPLGAHLSFFA